MKVRILKPGLETATHGKLQVGDVIDLFDDVAKVWISRGLVKEVADDEPETAPKKEEA